MPKVMTGGVAGTTASMASLGLVARERIEFEMVTAAPPGASVWLLMT